MMSTKLRVGIVGTGYAAQRRVTAFLEDGRAQLVAVAGQWPDGRARFAQTYGIEAIADWQELVHRDGLDLIVVCTINRLHGAVARAALEAGKHVVVEYPLSLDPTEAAELIQLAQGKGCLLHVEHIELLGGLHQTIKRTVPTLGQVTYASYATLAPKRKALPHWTFHHRDYGFPFVAALSRVNRLLDLFGSVAEVSGAASFLPAAIPGYYESCLCTGQLTFESGVIAHLAYGKGRLVETGDRRFRLYGSEGTLEFVGNQGVLLKGGEPIRLEAGSRRGVFLQDTAAVLDYLEQGQPLYVQPETSLYALQIADQIHQSANGKLGLA